MRDEAIKKIAAEAQAIVQAHADYIAKLKAAVEQAKSASKLSIGKASRKATKRKGESNVQVSL